MVWPLDGKVATIGGTLCTLGAVYSWADLLSTVAMAGVGTVVSFLISVGMSKWLKGKK